jgi:signal transduction histidine kinase
MPGAVLAAMRRFGRRYPLLADGLHAVASGTVSLLLGLYGVAPDGVRPFDALGVALTCVAALSLVARQRAPVVVVLFYCAVWAGFVYLGYWSVVNSPGALLALYTVAALRPPRVTAAVAVLGSLIWLYATPGSLGLAFVQAVVWNTVIARFGHHAQLLAARNADLVRLADRLAFEQEERSRRAVVDEQIRIARELHDVVAHHMSVISVHAGLAQHTLDSDRETARASIATVMDASSEALEEMRRMLAVLRPVQDSVRGRETGPQGLAPGLARLDDLVDRVRMAGLSVTVEVTGARQPLPPGLDTCVYRVIQEALTNVLKHANATAVTVTLQYDESRLSARVRDDGHHTTTVDGSSRTGQGINGMRERARLYGGTLAAGPLPRRGFEILLVVPIHPPLDEQLTDACRSGSVAG